jgi:hypothetical protein
VPLFVNRADLVPAYVRLLRDNEAEVRIAAAGKVTKFCRILSHQLAIQHILPCVKVGEKLLLHIICGLLLPVELMHTNCNYRSSPRIHHSMFVQLWLQSSWGWLLFWERYCQ